MSFTNTRIRTIFCEVCQVPVVTKSRTKKYCSECQEVVLKAQKKALQEEYKLQKRKRNEK